MSTGEQARPDLDSREQIDQDRVKAEQEIDELRRRQCEELEEEHAEQQRRLHAELQSLDEKRSEVETELKKQRVLVESRARFQKDHLTRSQKELAAFCVVF